MPTMMITKETYGSVDCHMMALFVTTTEAQVVAIFIKWRGVSSSMVCSVSWVLFFDVYFLVWYLKICEVIVVPTMMISKETYGSC